MEKMTNKKALVSALNFIPSAEIEIREKIEKMIEQLDKKNASPKKLTDQQKKNEYLRGVIVEAMERERGYTVSELIHFIPELSADSNQHVSALMRALVTEGIVVKYEDKRRSYFKLA